MEINRPNQTCPHCSEVSSIEVTVCRQCGQQLRASEYLSPSVSKGTESTPQHPTGFTDPFPDNSSPGQKLVPQPGPISPVGVPSRNLQIGSWPRRALLVAGLLTIGTLGTGGIAYLINNEQKNSTPMVKVTIKLVDVYCSIKEAMVPMHDHFYVMTAFAAPDKDPNAQVSIQAQLSHPVDITSRQNLEFPNGPLTVFEGLVPEQGEVKGGFIAYNDQLGLAWDNIDSWIADIKQSVASGLVQEGVTSASLASFATGEILNLATKAWLTNAQMSSEDARQLGREELVVPATGHSSEYLAWQFSRHISVLDNWNYTVKYQIFRSLVNS